MQVNESINLIETKIKALQDEKKVPDIQLVFSGFSWTREWFRSAEDIMLDLAYRGESDAAVVNFIKQKIVDTEVMDFNLILAKFGAVPIINHYEWILQSDIIDLFDMACNTNDCVARVLIREEYFHRINLCLSSNPNDIIVKRLIENPRSICVWRFLMNPNDRAVEYCIKNIIPEYRPISISENYVALLSSNSNDKAVDIVLANPNEINFNGISFNTNDRAVEYLLSKPDKIDWEILSSNPNEKAVDYMLDHMDKVDWFSALSNTNPRMATVFLSKLDELKKNNDIKYRLSSNNCDVVVDYLLANPHEINWLSFTNNNNDRAVEYVMSEYNRHTWDSMVSNSCTYDMQKFREFNKLGLFERIPHFTLDM